MKISVIVVSLLQLACTQLIFQPISDHIYTPAVVDVRYDDIYATAHDGIRLHGWKLHARQKRQGALVFFHGNGENISTHFANVYWLVDHGYDIYAFDYRGYGKSQGFPDLDLIMQDFDPTIESVLSDIADGEKLVIMGHSFGASMVLSAVPGSRYRHRFSSVISVAAFSDYHDIAREMLSRSWLSWALQWPLSFTIDNSYRPLDVIQDISPVPLLLMHSRQDEVIDFYHSMVLYDKARPPKQFIEIDIDHSHTFNSENNRQLLLDYLGQLQTGTQN